jgi:hypothetical protein
MLIAWTVAVVLVWMTASRGLCGELDGNDLLRTCTEGLRYFDNEYRSTSAEAERSSMWCLGYMLGWVNGYTWGATALCVPPDQITALQLVRIVVKYLRDHPQRLHYRRDVLIWSALQEAFPCSKRGSDLTDELFGPASPASSTPPPPRTKRQR